jgi:hypothetical protein
MSFLAWIILGLIAGFIGSKIVNKTVKAFSWTSYWGSSVRLSVAGFLVLWALME